jgi:DNA polymerase III delta prime subunit
LLTQVKQEVESRLNQSLHNAVLINLGKQSQPEQVKRPWDAEIKIGAKPSEPLPADIEILQVFDRPDIAGKLLILGEPGSGKTTTLLDLAKALVTRAEANTTYSIPVLLNLSSWKDPKQQIKDWLIEELKSKYGVKKELGQQWLEAKQLLPLLDGLDEVKPADQEACVQRINQWLQSDTRPMSLAICCRREEYETVIRGRWQAQAEDSAAETRLQLNGAILLQALNDDQIQVYLQSANQADLWQLLQQDADLLTLIRTPLLLSITLISYQEVAEINWQRLTSTEQRLEQLLDAYVQKMLHRSLKESAYGKRQPPSAKQTRRWLIFLAQQMEAESQTEFLIEKMQPFWLKTARQKWTYRLIFGLIGGLIFGLIFGLIGGLIFGLIGGLIFGLIGGLIFGLIFGLIGGLIFGLIGGLIFGLIFGLRADIETRIKPNQGIWNSAQNMVIILGIACVIVPVIYFSVPIILSPLSHILSKQNIASIVSSAIAMLIWSGFQEGGGQACIQHLSLRWVLYRSNYAPWNYARFLDYCTHRLFLQRIGGRYRLIHKLLQDHFARMEL